MFDLEKIKAIDKKAVEKQWPYPYIFNALKSIGVERYETNVLTHEIKYVGGGANVVAPAPEGWTKLTAAPAFNPDALKKALERVQARETTYPQFLAEIATAGVGFYRVDMGPRTVTYHGPTSKDKLVEPVPDTIAT